VLRKVSEIGKRTVETIRSSKKSSVTLRAPKESRGSLRGAGMMGTWGGKSAKQAAASLAVQPTAPLVIVPARNQEKHVFGMPLHVLMERQEKNLDHFSVEDKEKLRMLTVPLIVNKMIEHLLLRAVKEEGFLRIAASRDETDSFKQMINNGEAVDFYKISVHAIGDLLKSFVRDIPGSLFEASKMDRWMAIADLEPAATRAQQCKNLLLELDHNNRALITILFRLLNQVRKKQVQIVVNCCNKNWKVVLNKGSNKMDVINVGRVFAPNILVPRDAIMSMTCIPKVAIIVETLITHHTLIFKELDVQHKVTPVFFKKKDAFLFINFQTAAQYNWNKEGSKHSL
jgi:hypothetical protein